MAGAFGTPKHYLGDYPLKRMRKARGALLGLALLALSLAVAASKAQGNTE